LAMKPRCSANRAESGRSSRSEMPETTLRRLQSAISGARRKLRIGPVSMPAHANEQQNAVRLACPDTARARLLVIECDSQALSRQRLHLGTPFGQVVKELFPNKRIVVRTADLAKLF
jgi:hypothetical protein